MKIIIIIPTYNERQIIGRLLEAVENEIRNIANHEFEILVVDGNSPDGTPGVIREKARRYPNIDLIVEEKKEGLGMAYIGGMNYALRELGADAILEFDGDFQHDPKDIRRLVAELDKGYDYVIGSRYVPGGKIPKSWSLSSKFLSRFGGWLIGAVLGLETHDNTSGFKLSRVKNFVDKLPLDKEKLLSLRHAYKIHLLYEMLCLGAKVKEVPITFLPREGGNTKSTFEDTVQSLKVLFLLWLRGKRK